jgi:hypothetical protein
MERVKEVFALSVKSDKHSLVFRGDPCSIAYSPAARNEL